MKSKKQAKQKNRPRNKQVDWKALDIVHPDAAGIDIGGSEHWVAISPDRDETPSDASTALRRICRSWRTG